MRGRPSWASWRRHRPGGCAATTFQARWAGGRRGWARPGCRGPRSWPARCAAARWPSCCSCTRRCPTAPTPSTAASSSSAAGRRRAAPACAVSGRGAGGRWGVVPRGACSVPPPAATLPGAVRAPASGLSVGTECACLYRQNTNCGFPESCACVMFPCFCSQCDLRQFRMLGTRLVSCSLLPVQKIGSQKFPLFLFLRN